MDKITVVTVCKNCCKDLEITLQASLAQTYPQFEVIVVDGASTDGTVDALSRWEEQFASKGIDFRYISEPDSGIYNAMNKGIDMSAGDWIIFMNAGDCFAEKDTLENLFSLQNYDDYDIVYGDAEIRTFGKSKIRKGQPVTCLEKHLLASHQAIFARSKQLKKRIFDEHFKINADYEWNLYMYCSGGQFFYVPLKICVFDGNGISNTHKYALFCECMEIRKRYNMIHDPEWIIKLKKGIMFFVSIFNLADRKIKEAITR